MTIDEIRKRVTGGFRPFLIRTSDGREFRVPHPEFILIARYAVAVTDEDGHINTLAPMHIVSIKDLTGSDPRSESAA